MPELIGQHEDILMDLELLKRYSQEKEELSDNQKDSLKRLPKAKREARKEEILKEQEHAKKERLRIRTLELEDKVKSSDLPPDITNEILEMLAYAKDRNMTFIYSVERKIESLEVRIKEAEIKKAQEEEKQMKAIQNATMIGTAVVAGLALAPYVQVQFNKEEFDKKVKDFYEEKIVAKFLEPKTKSIKPLEIKRIYPTKLGSMYPKSYYKLEKKHDDELMDILVRDIQRKQKKMGKKVQTAAEIRAEFAKMPEAKKRYAKKGILVANPEVAKRQSTEKKLDEKAVIDKNIIRQRRRKAVRAAKTERFLAKQARLTEQAKQTLRKDRVARKDPRIAARPGREKPAEVKEISPATDQAKLAPTAVKEKEAPKGISARLTKVEQLAGKNKDAKGISAALAAAEHNKIQEAEERVRAESKGKFNPDDRVVKPLTPEQKSRLEAVVKSKNTRSPEYWRQAVEARQYRKTG